MAGRKQKKEPFDAGTPGGRIDGDASPDTVNPNTLNGESQDRDGDGPEHLDDRVRYATYLVYPTEEWIRRECPECDYDGRNGWGEAPDDWREQFIQTGLQFAVSPLHWKDRDLDGDTGELLAKKPHWHVIVAWGGPTTYRSALKLCDITKGPRPRVLPALTGMYRYLTHLDNPEKYQYELSDGLKPDTYNGFAIPLGAGDVDRILDELEMLVYEKDCREYNELLMEARMLGPEYHTVAAHSTVFLKSVCAGYRNEPERCKARLSKLKECEQKRGKAQNGGLTNESCDN